MQRTRHCRRTGGLYATRCNRLRDRLRAAGKSITRRCDIRAEAAMNIDDVITFMALLEAMEGPTTIYARPEPEVPSAVADVTAEAKAAPILDVNA